MGAFEAPALPPSRDISFNVRRSSLTNYEAVRTMPPMPSSDKPKPTEAELQILALLWRRGPSTVRQVHDDLGERTGYTSVLKLMQIMAEKGIVARETTGRSHIYRPAQAEAQTQRRLAADLMQRAFGGSAASSSPRHSRRAAQRRPSSMKSADLLRDEGGHERGHVMNAFDDRSRRSWSIASAGRWCIRRGKVCSSPPDWRSCCGCCATAPRQNATPPACLAMALIVAAAGVTFERQRPSALAAIRANRATRTRRLRPFAAAHPPPPSPLPIAIQPIQTPHRGVLDYLVIAWSVGVVMMAIWHIGGWLWLLRLRRGKPIERYQPRWSTVGQATGHPPHRPAASKPPASTCPPSSASSGR